VTGDKAAATSNVTVAREAGPRLKVSSAHYGMATAEVRHTPTETGATTEMAAAAEMCTPTAEVAATTASEMPTTTAGMPAAPAATSTVSSSGTGRHGGTRSECGHGEDLEGPAQKS
jgi:hypothetical protein